MTFSSPVSLEDAIAELQSKKLVPTWLSSEDLRGLASDVKSRALFSARMTQLRPLEALMEGLAEMLAGDGNLADAKLKLTEALQSMGYDAEAGGFPQDEPGKVPPAVRGTLRDLASQRRMELTITTNYRMAVNAAFVQRGNEEQRRYQWPCYELVRIGTRRTPRGFKRGDAGLEPVPGDDWASRFVAAGGELFDKGTRMIAAKDSPVWQALGDGEGGYKDTLGNPYAPFAFGSGMGLREVPRAECLLVGVIAPEDKIAQVPVSLAKSLKADAAKVDPKLLAAFKKDLVKREDGSVRLKRMLEADLKAADASYRGVKNRVAWLLNMGTKAGALKGWETRRKKARARVGVDAMKKAVAGRMDVEKAMMIPGLGTIDFLWGARGAKSSNEQGATHWGGWGIHHIHSKRGDKAVATLPIVMAHGKVSRHDRDPGKRYVKYAGWTAVIKRQGKGRWSVTTLIDDDINPRSIKNRAARSPVTEAGPTTQVRTRLEFLVATHTNQLFAEADAGAEKAASMTPLQQRCKSLLDRLRRAA